MMTSCGQQPLNVLAVLLLLISAGRPFVMLGGRGEGAGGLLLGSARAQLGFWVPMGVPRVPCPVACPS